MTLTKWNPLRELETMQQDMNRLFSRAGGGFGNWFDPTMKYDLTKFDPMRFDGGDIGSRRNWTLATDVIETEGALKLRASLPGVDPKDVNIQVEDGVLTISAERRFEDKVEKDQYCWVEQQYGSFSRALSLPKYADTEHIEAAYNNGVLELTIPKKESSKPRKIELNAGSSTPAIEAGEGSGPANSPVEAPQS
jgi:HSP20 family protein